MNGKMSTIELCNSIALIVVGFTAVILKGQALYRHFQASNNVSTLSATTEKK